MTDCEQLRENYEAYALGVLEGEERAELETHLERGCPACTRGVAEARTLLSQLAYAAPETEPPASLRRAVLESVRRGGQRPLIPAWAWIGVAALLLFSVYTTLQTRRLLTDMKAQQTRLEAQKALATQLATERQRYEQILIVISASGTREIDLRPAALGAPLPKVRAYWNQERGLVLTAEQVPAPAADRTYQLWVVRKTDKGKPVSAGVFRPESTGKILVISLPDTTMSDAAALAITDEPAGGSPQPTTSPLWVGPVR